VTLTDNATVLTAVIRLENLPLPDGILLIGAVMCCSQTGQTFPMR